MINDSCRKKVKTYGNVSGNLEDPRWEGGGSKMEKLTGPSITNQGYPGGRWGGDGSVGKTEIIPRNKGSKRSQKGRKRDQ